MIGQELVQDLLHRTNGTGVLSNHSMDFGSTKRNQKPFYSTSSQAYGAVSPSSDQENENFNGVTFSTSGSKLTENRPKQKKVRFLTTDELRVKNKEGLSYSLLFNHTNTGDDISPKDRYTTINRLSSSHYLFKNENVSPQNTQQNNCNSIGEDGMHVTYNKRLNTLRNSNNIKDIYHLPESMFPPLSVTHARNKAKEVMNESELIRTRPTALESANRLLTSAYPADQCFPGTPYASVGRNEVLPSAKRLEELLIVSQSLTIGRTFFHLTIRCVNIVRKYYVQISLENSTNCSVSTFSLPCPVHAGR